MGILLKVLSMSLGLAASLASLSAVSLPRIPAWALTQENSICQFESCRVANLFLISSMRYAWFLVFCRESSVTLLSVYVPYLCADCFLEYSELQWLQGH